MVQNEVKIVPTETKIKLVQKLVNAGCQYIETASFVSPRWVPAMADSKDVMIGLKAWRDAKAGEGTSHDEPVSMLHSPASAVFSVLTPNLKGFENAMSVGDGVVDEVAIFASASETFSKKNIDCTIQESLARFREVTEKAKDYNIPVRGYVSCVLGCPYEGNVDASSVAKVAKELVEMGCHEISLGAYTRLDG